MIVLTGGGTGGHLSIIKNLKIELVNRGYRVIYIGSTRGQDKFWFQDDNDFDKVYFLSSRGFSSNLINKFLAMINLVSSMVKVLFIFRKHKATKVISVGGFSSAPSALVAILFRYDLYIHEQNSVIGRLNKITKPFAKKFFCSFPQEGIKTIGYPILDEFFRYAREKEQLKTILFLGGSNGAVFINDIALLVAKFLQQNNIDIIHQCGKKDFDRVQQEYKRLGVKADVFAFSNKIYEKMQKADFAVSRSGASTVWELIASKLPTLFIPYRYAIFNHQFLNAQFLVYKKLGFCIQEKDFMEKEFLNIINNFINLNNDISNISVKLGLLKCQNGTRDIIDIITSDNCR
jgi:UDP-N-acetylglucosamine--N-acetylmuramyl-(pentapeptide) pyrophosphoryl-undecaprenol N-acetylglucosamine transferase